MRPLTAARWVITGAIVVANVAMVLMFVGAGTSFSLQRQAFGADFHQRCVEALALDLELSPYGDEVVIGPLRFAGKGVVRGAYEINPSDTYPRDRYPGALSGHVRCILDAPKDELVVKDVEVES